MKRDEHLKKIDRLIALAQMIGSRTLELIGRGTHESLERISRLAQLSISSYYLLQLQPVQEVESSEPADFRTPLNVET